MAIEMLVPGVELLLKFLRDEGEPLHAAWSTEGLISLEDGLGQRDEITEHFEYLLRFGSAPRATPPEPPSLFARLLAVALPRWTNAGSQLHGPDHWRRIATIGAHLAGKTPGADARVVEAFAAFHVCRPSFTSTGSA